MKTEFKSFKNTSDVKSFFQEALLLNSATPFDVFSFLEEHELEYSELVKIPEPDTLSIFDSVIFVSTPARSIGWLIPLKANWHIQFHFLKNKLVEIDVNKQGIGL